MQKIKRHNNSILIFLCVISYIIIEFNFYQFNFFDLQYKIETSGGVILIAFFFTQIPALFGVITTRVYPPYKNNYLSINSFLSKEKVVKYYIPVLLIIVLTLPLLLFKTQSESDKLDSYVVAVHYGVLSVLITSLLLKSLLYTFKINFYKSVFNFGYVLFNWQILNYTRSILIISILILINVVVIIFGILSSYSFQKDIFIENPSEPIYVKYIEKRKYLDIRMKIKISDNRKMIQILKSGELIRENGKEYIKVNDQKIQVIETDNVKVNPYSIPYSIFSGT